MATQVRPIGMVTPTLRGDARPGPSAPGDRLTLSIPGAMKN
jgi:hypothetical protein